MNCGIYAIVCSRTWRSYVGQSVNIEKRVQTHFQDLRRKTHSAKEMQADFNEFGEDSFSYEILELVSDVSTLITREKCWANFSTNLYSWHNCHHRIPDLTTEQIEGFWSKVDIKSVDECWNYQGTIVKDGYGKIKACGRHILAHRLSYFLSNKDDDPNCIICHKCNNTSCVNPNHLYSGTYQDNAKDILDSNSRCTVKLTWEWVKLIRNKYIENPSISGTELQKWFCSNIADIKFDKDYLIDVSKNLKWIDKDYKPPTRPSKRLTFELAEEIRKLSKDGMRNVDIIRYFKEKYNKSLLTSTVSDTINNKAYTK